jgi:hypothetical protein
LTGSEEEDGGAERAEAMHRLYPGSDIWVCDYCELQSDIHAIKNHVPTCDKNKQQKKTTGSNNDDDDDKEQTTL